MRVCSGAGCLRAVPDDVRFCDECKPVTVEEDDSIRVHTLTDRERYAFLYSSARWQRLRARALALHPFCGRCEKEVTEIIDHVVPAGVAVQQARDSGLYKGDKYAGFFILSNLQGLCRACHYAKTMEDKLHTGIWKTIVTKSVTRKWSF